MVAALLKFGDPSDLCFLTMQCVELREAIKPSTSLTAKFLKPPIFSCLGQELISLIKNICSKNLLAKQNVAKQ